MKYNVYKILAGINIVVFLLCTVFYIKYPTHFPFSDALDLAIASGNLAPLWLYEFERTILGFTAVVFLIFFIKRNPRPLAELGVLLGTGGTLSLAATLILGFILENGGGLFLLPFMFFVILLWLLSNLMILIGLGRTWKEQAAIVVFIVAINVVPLGFILGVPFAIAWFLVTWLLRRERSV